MRSIWLGSAVAAYITIEAVNAAFAQSEIGKDDYLKLCSGCHGVTGKGDEPNGKGLHKPPADLTKLLQTNDGKFPLLRVYLTIDGRLETIMHGPRDMPNLFDTLRRDIMSRRADYLSYEFAEGLARLRMVEVIEYVMTLQRN